MDYRGLKVYKVFINNDPGLKVYKVFINDVPGLNVYKVFINDDPGLNVYKVFINDDPGPKVYKVFITDVPGLTLTYLTARSNLFKIAYCADTKPIFNLHTMTLVVLAYHYVNVSVLINFSQKTSVFTLIIISSP